MVRYALAAYNASPDLLAGLTGKWKGRETEGSKKRIRKGEMRVRKEARRVKGGVRGIEDKKSKSLALQTARRI